MSDQFCGAAQNVSPKGPTNSGIEGVDLTSTAAFPASDGCERLGKPGKTSNTRSHDAEHIHSIDTHHERLALVGGKSGLRSFQAGS
jgi:hypothetical protein